MDIQSMPEHCHVYFITRYTAACSKLLVQYKVSLQIKVIIQYLTFIYSSIQQGWVNRKLTVSGFLYPLSPLVLFFPGLFSSNLYWSLSKKIMMFQAAFKLVQSADFPTVESFMKKFRVSNLIHGLVVSSSRLIYNWSKSNLFFSSLIVLQH